METFVTEYKNEKATVVAIVHIKFDESLNNLEVTKPLARQEDVAKITELCINTPYIVEASVTSLKKDSNELITTKFKPNDQATD